MFFKLGIVSFQFCLFIRYIPIICCLICYLINIFIICLLYSYSYCVLALTTKYLVIAGKMKHYRSANNYKSLYEGSYFEIRTIYPLDKLKLSIFKHSKRQVLKLTNSRKAERYYELGNCSRRKVSKVPRYVW